MFLCNTQQTYAVSIIFVQIAIRIMKATWICMLGSKIPLSIQRALEYFEDQRQRTTQTLNLRYSAIHSNVPNSYILNSDQHLSGHFAILIFTKKCFWFNSSWHTGYFRVNRRNSLSCRLYGLYRFLVELCGICLGK